MEMFRQEATTELDLLNKQIRDFLVLYEWLQDKEEVGTVLERYSRPGKIMKDALGIIAREINAAGDLPSESDRDRQDLEQLVIFLQSLVAEKKEEVAAEHLGEATAKIKTQLSLLNKTDYSAMTSDVIMMLEVSLGDFPEEVG